MNNGWVKLHRSLLDWEWYGDTNVTRLFLHLLLKANHKDKSWQGNTVKAGQLITGRKVLSKETGLTEQQIRSSLDKLKSTNEITIESTSRYSMITVVAWDSYQQNSQELTSDQPTDNQQITTNKKVNNEKNDKKEDISPTGSRNKVPANWAKDLIDEYHRCLPEWPRVEVINDDRKKAAKRALKFVEGSDKLEFWEHMFLECKGVPFLEGRNDRSWHATFDYILSNKGMVKIYEGGYSK